MVILPGRAHLRFRSLRSRLFAAFAGVLVLSLLLTAGSFWLQIRLLNTQRVQADLRNAAPGVRHDVSNKLVLYWETNTPLTKLRDQLTAIARAAGVRILLTDYCNHVPIDTNSKTPLRVLAHMQVPSTCSQVLDDVTGGRAPEPISLTIDLDGDQVHQANLPGSGTTLYLPFAPPPFFSYASVQGGATPLLVRTIIIAKSSSGIDQEALTRILPQLVAAGIVAMLLTLLVVVLIVRAITRPLHTITAASERMARGDYDQRVPEAGEDEVGQLARSFNRMALEVGTAREHQRQFIANVSHDLKTPLTSILGFSQILAEGERAGSDDIQRRAVKVINEEARRLQRLTLDLLDLSRLEAGHLHLQRSYTDLNELAGQAFMRFADLPANRSLTFHDQRTSVPLTVLGDPDRLMQVLVNLLDNAVKFCDPQGRVALSTARRGNEVMLTVANTGTGIPPEDLAHVFQRFYRADHSRATRTGGTGLGLAIVREIAVAHGGRVEAHSDADGWTRFTLILHSAAVVDQGANPGDTEPGMSGAP